MVSSLTVCGGKTICSPTPCPFPNPPVESIQAILPAPGRALRYRLRGAGIARARASGPVVSSHPGASIECSHARGSHHPRSEEHTSELQSRGHLVCRLLLEKKKPHNI